MIVSISLKVSDHNYLIATASWDGKVRVYSPDYANDTGMVVDDHHDKKVTCVAFTERCALLGTASFDSSVTLLDLFAQDRERILLLLLYTNLPVDVARVVRALLFW